MERYYFAARVNSSVHGWPRFRAYWAGMLQPILCVARTHDESPAAYSVMLQVRNPISMFDVIHFNMPDFFLFALHNFQAYDMMAETS